MKLINKQPIFKAEQFTGTEESVKLLGELIGKHKMESWQLTRPSFGDAEIKFKVYGEADVSVKEGHWLMRHPDGTLETLRDHELWKRFDKAPTVDQNDRVSFGKLSLGEGGIVGIRLSDQWKRGLV